ncbi:MAG TPA: hypothetical protein VLX68_07365 [Chitinivibrionales bacterium]|nr:hypothetical protein [Chitinivibrionales bacterium]
MMLIIFPLIAASALVFFGYFALWSSAQATTPKSISSFGRILSIILFVIAGVVLFSPVAMRHFHGRHFTGGMGMQGRPPMMGSVPQHWMGKRFIPPERGQQFPAPAEKPEAQGPK